jgi:hypothetical protein
MAAWAVSTICDCTYDSTRWRTAESRSISRRR